MNSALANTPAIPPTATDTATDTATIFTKEQIRSKNYIIFENGVYDIQNYLPRHPGGDKILRGFLGQDVTTDFYNTGHSKRAVEILQGFYVGDAVQDEEEGVVTKTRRKLWSRELRLDAVTQLNEGSCWEFCFSYSNDNGDSTDDKVVLSPGGHIKLTVEDDKGRSCTRSYTPVQFDSERGKITLAIKLYSNGEMSSLLQPFTIDGISTSDGISFSMTGPFGDIVYNDNGSVSVGDTAYSCRDNLIMIAGGTGITPFLSLLRHRQDDPNWKHDTSKTQTATTIVYCAKTEDELMYQEELSSLLALEKSSNNKLHVISPSSRNDIVSRVTNILPPSSATKDTLCVICGPPAMEDALSKALASTGHTQILTSTVIASSPSAPAVTKKPSSSTSWLTQNGKLHLVMFAIALILPLAAIALNKGVPSSWPHYEAFPPNAVGFNGAFSIVGFNETNSSGEKVSRYAYRLSDPSVIQYASPWVGYVIHQTLTLWILYRAFRQQPKYATYFRDFNWHMLIVQTFGIVLKYGQQYFFYNGLSETLPLGFGTGTVFLYLVVVMIMYIPVRGLFFGYGKDWSWTNECVTFFRTYHGFFIGTFIINDFWYHPFESTVGHLTGILNDAMLLAQMVIIYTPFHLNKYWCVAMETFVIFHAALIALNRGTVGAVGSFGYAFFFIFVATQMHGLGWSRLIRFMIGLVFVTSIMIVYGLKLQGEDKGWKAMVMEVFLRIPVLEYFTIFFILGYFILAKKIVQCFKGTVAQRVAIGCLITVGTAICFMPLIAIFL